MLLNHYVYVDLHCYMVRKFVIAYIYKISFLLYCFLYERMVGSGIMRISLTPSSVSPFPSTISGCSFMFWFLDLLVLFLRPGVTHPCTRTRTREATGSRVHHPILPLQPWTHPLEAALCTEVLYMAPWKTLKW